MKKLMKMLILFVLAIALIPSPFTADAQSDPLKVVATTTQVADLIRQIGGDHVQVEGLMAAGIDPHGYNASASDVTKMADADIVAHNGFHLEGQMGEIFQQMDKLGKEVISLEEAIPEDALLDSADDSLPMDPHIWFDVELWQLSADYVANRLSEIAPDYAEAFAQNKAAYQTELEDLDQYIRDRVAEIPEERRFLVTAHDAFGYLGQAYGLQVVGLQGLNTQTEAGTSEVSGLADFIVENEIPAIFIESSVPTRTIESLQEAVLDRGFQVEIGGELYSDSLGDVSQDAETYIKMYRQNIDTIVEALK